MFSFSKSFRGRGQVVTYKFKNKVQPRQEKLQNAKVSGSGNESVSKVKEEVDDMFPFLVWLDPFYKPRKPSSNLIRTVESESEVDDPSCDDDTSNENIKQKP